MVTPSILTGRVFLARDAIASGLLTPDRLRSRSWQRLFRGVYADASLDVTPTIRFAAVVAFLGPPGATIAGRSAATLLGAQLGGPADPVELLIPSSALPCRHAGIVVHRGSLAEADRVEHGRIPVTSPARTCWDLACWLDPVECVVWMDRLLALGRVTAPELAALLDHRGLSGERGTRRFEKALSLVDRRAESPQESRLRVRLTLGGLRPPAVQHAIYDANGRFVARVDLAWPERRVAIEYDGLWHVGSPAQVHADRRRLSALASLGWTVLVVTSQRLRDDLPGLARELRAALRLR
ncbi:MAG TPA: DUF559 domain-containing protein [Micromonosporaceae bacterium]